MLEIEIFDRPSGAIQETVEVSDLKSFRTYWNEQCDRVQFGFRIKGSTAPGYQHYVRREPNEHGSRKAETLPLDGDLLSEIATLNASLSADQVREALMLGRTVYTSFSKFTLES